MYKADLIILILIGAVLFVVGAGLGVFYQIQKDIPQIKKGETVSILSSNVIPSIVAFGYVTKIDGRNITLTFNEDSLTVPIKENSQVVSFPRASVGNASPSAQKVEFKDIKVGDLINISVKVLADGLLEGGEVMIIPPINTPAQ